MKVLKFGGTSVGTPQRMKEVSRLITDGQQKIVVLSAMSGTTNSLVEIADYFKKRNGEAANNVINKLRTVYMGHVKELFSSREMADATADLLEDIFMYLHSFSSTDFTEVSEKTILAQGELMSTNMVGTCCLCRRWKRMKYHSVCHILSHKSSCVRLSRNCRGAVNKSHPPCHRPSGCLHLPVLR